MGKQFARVVTLVVAGEIFAQGLMATGTVAYLIDVTKGLGLSGALIMVVMTLFITIISIVMGSGNAPFFAFAPLVPDFAREFGVSTILLILPMQRRWAARSPRLPASSSPLRAVPAFRPLKSSAARPSRWQAPWWLLSSQR